MAALQQSDGQYDGIRDWNRLLRANRLIWQLDESYSQYRACKGY